MLTLVTSAVHRLLPPDVDFCVGKSQRREVCQDDLLAAVVPPFAVTPFVVNAWYCNLPRATDADAIAFVHSPIVSERQTDRPSLCLIPLFRHQSARCRSFSNFAV